MNIAILPWSDKCLDNMMFKVTAEEEDVYTRVFSAQKEYFESRGNRYETIDQYSNWEEIDWIIVYYGTIYNQYMRSILKKGYQNKLVYYALEPEVVVPSHNCHKMKRYLDFFKYIITWNKEAVDNKRIFYINCPYMMKVDFGDETFEERKLLTAIYSNKSGRGKKELYSERLKIFQYFEEIKDVFDLYGYGWSSNKLINYRGQVKNKAKVYHKYRFAIALENIKGVSGCVSEKIFDCLCAGVVPIYLGANDIKRYVPENVFIDYGKFNNVGELHIFLEGIDKETWEGYIESARKYLNSEQTNKVGVDTYCQILEELLCANPAEDIRCNNLKVRVYIIKLWILDTFFVRGCRYVWRKILKALKTINFNRAKKSSVSKS